MERMDDELDVDAQFMEDEDYAEWMWVGMWSVLKLKGVSSQEEARGRAPYEERMRKQAEHDACKAREKAIREETKRLEHTEEEERMKQRRARERLSAVEARELYETRWKALLAPSSAASADPSLGCADIPWPVHLACVAKGHAPLSLRVDDLTVDTVSACLLPSSAATGILTCRERSVANGYRMQCSDSTPSNLKAGSCLGCELTRGTWCERLAEL